VALSGRVIDKLVHESRNGTGRDGTERNGGWADGMNDGVIERTMVSMMCDGDGAGDGRKTKLNEMEDRTCGDE